MPLGVLTVGGLTLNENYKIQDATNAQSGVRTVNLEGIETYPGRTLAQVRALADDLTSMYGKTVPVVFQHKTDRTGYYTIDDVNTSAVHWEGEAASFTWSLGLTRIGPDNSVDIESRLVHVVRANDFSQTGERWHAPAIGHYGYYVGAATPATVVRTGADGPITVYRAIPAVNPRWASPASTFRNGRVRFIDDNLIERTGERIRLTAVNSWEMNNGLIRVKPQPNSGTTTSILVAAYDGTTWRERAWDIRIDGIALVPVTHWRAVMVLRNDPEMVAMRILSDNPTNGSRVLVDLVLRRGSRIVEGYVQRAVSGQVSVQLDVLETFNSPSGGVTIASGEDSNGLRWAAGSAKTFSGATNGGVSQTSVVALDFWLGAEVPKPSVGGTNVGFETGSISPWTGFNATPSIQSDTPKHGSFYGRATAIAAATDMRLALPETGVVGVAGKQYTVSGWIRSPVALTAGQAFLQLSWYNGGSFLSGGIVSAPALVANTWTPVSGTLTAPATTTLIGRSAGIVAAAVSVGSILDVDSLQLREVIDSGEASAGLQAQYIAAPSEATMVVAR